MMFLNICRSLGKALSCVVNLCSGHVQGLKPAPRGFLLLSSLSVQKWWWFVSAVPKQSCCFKFCWTIQWPPFLTTHLNNTILILLSRTKSGRPIGAIDAPCMYEEYSVFWLPWLQISHTCTLEYESPCLSYPIPSYPRIFFLSFVCLASIMQISRLFHLNCTREKNRGKMCWRQRNRRKAKFSFVSHSFINCETFQAVHIAQP